MSCPVPPDLDSTSLLRVIPIGQHQWVEDVAITLYSLAFFPGTILTNRALKDQVVRSVEGHFDKMYHDDIRSTYAYFLFLINAKFNVSNKLNRFLMSDAMVKSKAGIPIRFILSHSTQIYKTQAKIMHWFATALPESFQIGIVRSLFMGRKIMSKVLRRSEQPL